MPTDPFPLCKYMPVPVKKHSSREDDLWEDRLSEHQIRGWIEVSAKELPGEGSHERSVFSQTPVVVRSSFRFRDLLGNDT